MTFLLGILGNMFIFAGVNIYAAAGAGKTGAYDKIVSMRELKIVTEVKVYK